MKTNNKSLTATEKKKFRQSKEWKEFRVKKLQDADNKCECCGVKSKVLHLHHKNLDKEQYTNISNPSHFVILCKSCHDIAHFYFNRLIHKTNQSKNPAMFNLIRNFFILSPENVKKLENFNNCPSCNNITSNNINI